MLLWLLVLAAPASLTGVLARDYFGTYIGKFQNRFHGITGDVYAVDSRTIYIKGFSYDGEGPDAYFWAGKSGQPSRNGFQIADEKGSLEVLKEYSRTDLVLTLPGGNSLKDLKWVSVWCESFGVNFGEVSLPARLEHPRPQKIAAFNGQSGVFSDKVVVVDAQTFLIPNFTYDGQAPDAHFHVGRGARVGPEGTNVPDENGSLEPLRKYTEKTLVIVLPGELTIFDIDWLSIWCVDFFVDFGHVRIPKNLNVPPSLRMLGVEPQSKLNCEVLDESMGLEVRWAIAGKSIVTQLVARLRDNQYMAFGLSGDFDASVMVGGDVTVTWMDHRSGKGFAEDYYLDAKSQCAGKRGACPDSNIRPGSNNVRLLNSAVISEFTMLTYRQPLTNRDRLDVPILTNGSQAVIWAVGPVNSEGEVSYHQKHVEGDLFFDFGRIPRWNCPIAGKQQAASLLPERPRSSSAAGAPAVKAPAFTAAAKAPPAKAPLSSPLAPSNQPSRAAAAAVSGGPQPVASPKQAWFIPPIQCNEPEDGVFFAQIGPTGGDSGYSAITGHVGWGISWYINGLLIPEIHVVRGKTYTFVVEGGLDPEFAAGYHPFYITDDPEGGYEFKTPQERRKVKVFAGVQKTRGGGTEATATGRLCEWKEDPKQPAKKFSSFGAYQRSLSLNCQEGQPGILQWTPDRQTPDVVYYQCYTHRYLGWRIRVHNTCN